MRAESALQAEIMYRLAVQHRELVAVAVPNGAYFFGSDRARAAIMVKSWKRSGLLTPGAGDLVLAGAGRVAFIEIKTPARSDLLGKKRQGGQLSDEQRAFRDRCEACGVPYFVVRSWEDVESAIATVWGEKAKAA